jgi:hypothetical protein
MRARATTTARFVRGAAAAAVVAIASIAGCGTEPDTQRYTIEGRVTEALTERRLEGVLVTFTSDTLYTADARTGSQGRYTLQVESDVLFGQVRAERDGYTPTETTVYFDRPDRRIDLVMSPSP